MFELWGELDAFEEVQSKEAERGASAVMEEMLLSVERAREFCLEVLEQVGVGGEEAARCAESMVYASLRGTDSHGLSLLPIYVERVRSGQIRSGRDLRVVEDGPVTVLCDGQHGVGPYLGEKAMGLARDRARENGLGAVSLRDGNYAGALAFYVEPLAREGLLALCMANATPRVAPPGGREGLHGTNPLAYAAPVAGGEPLVFDAATGHSAAKVDQAREEGRQLDEGVLLDRDGQVTTDPSDLVGGTLLPVGGFLGYGVGMLVDLLAGALNGGPCGRDVPEVSAVAGPYGCGFFGLVIDAGRFAGADVFAARSGFLAASAREVQPAAGAARVRVPGDRAREERARRLQRGIPFSRRRWGALLERLAGCGVDTAGWAAVDS